MPSQSSELSPILTFFLKLTKFAGEKKVPVLEWLLAWSTVVIFGLRYIIDYARLRWRLYKLAKSVVKATHTIEGGKSGNDNATRTLSASLPLCPLAHTEKEFSVGTAERWGRLCHVLLVASSSARDQAGEEKKDDGMIWSKAPKLESSVSKIATLTKDWNDEKWIHVFRSDLAVRREASYLMFAISKSEQEKSPTSQTEESIILTKLQRLWPRFLELPDVVVEGNRNNSSSYDISLIVPMYKERIEDISYTLHHAFKNCQGDPNKIQVVVVHVESDPDDRAMNDKNRMLKQELTLRQQQNQSTSIWGEMIVVTIPFGKGRGRGRTLNVGAREATAPILTFLHSDTMMPVGWDEKIKGALLSPSENVTSFPHACAFTMAIDEDRTSPIKSSSLLSKMSIAPGLIGAEWLGVLRCYCGLPYGDSVLSFSRPIFDYMGGYPDQPLMEDYETMDWMRLRSVLLSTMANAGTNKMRGEHLVLLKDRAKCSPRRWKKYGVAYTSLVNAICIFRYRSKATTEELFDFYYHCNSLNASKGSKQK